MHWAPSSSPGHALSTFILGPNISGRLPPKITFQGLVILLSSCPNLKSLGLVFDATKVDLPTAEKPGGGVCNINITSLHVGSSPIEQPLPVAIALSTILPCLRKIDVEYEIQGSFDRKARETKWREVLECINVYLLNQEGLRVQRRGLGVQRYDSEKIYAKGHLPRITGRIPSSDEWRMFKY
ncbi:hypothetical protein DFH29DRAFT_853134 [Suillus ampliporus]|nr:hypothetical protein DFH29DRAFT_853134 [Suillus ampliporus]